jgi:hypothetical protein
MISDGFITTAFFFFGPVESRGGKPSGLRMRKGSASTGQGSARASLESRGLDQELWGASPSAICGVANEMMTLCMLDLDVASIKASFHG